MPLDNSRLLPCTEDGCTFDGAHYHDEYGGGWGPCQCTDQNLHEAVGTRDGWPPCVLPRVTDEPRGEEPAVPVVLDHSNLRACIIGALLRACSCPEVHYHDPVSGDATPCACASQEQHEDMCALPFWGRHAGSVAEPAPDNDTSTVPVDDSNLEPCTVDDCLCTSVHYHDWSAICVCDCVDQESHESRPLPCVLPRVLTVPIEDVRVGDTVIIAPGTSFEVTEAKPVDPGRHYVACSSATARRPLLVLPTGALVMVRRPDQDAPILAALAKAADSSDPHALLAAIRAAGLTVEVAQ